LFEGLINQAKGAVSHLVLRYVARASVAIPFIIALGFALAAISVMLVQRFGHVTAYWIMAIGLVVIGVIAAIAVSVREHEEKVAEQRAQQSDTRRVVGAATSQAMLQAPLALLGALFTTPGGTASALKAAQVLGRNFPLVLLLVMIGALFWPNSQPDAEAVDQDVERRPGLAPAGRYH